MAESLFEGFNLRTLQGEVNEGDSLEKIVLQFVEGGGVYKEVNLQWKF